MKSLIKIVFLLAVASSAHAQSALGQIMSEAASLIKPEANLGIGVVTDNAKVTNEAAGTNGGLAQAGLSNQVTGGSGVSIGIGVAQGSADVTNKATADGKDSVAQAGLTNQIADSQLGMKVSVGIGVASGQAIVKNTADAKSGGTAQAGLSNQAGRGK